MNFGFRSEPLTPYDMRVIVAYVALLILAHELRAQPQAPEPPQRPSMAQAPRKSVRPNCGRETCPCGCADGDACRCAAQRKERHQENKRTPRPSRCSEQCTCGCQEYEACDCQETKPVPLVEKPTVPEPMPVSYYRINPVPVARPEPVPQYRPPAPAYYQPAPAQYQYRPVYQPAPMMMMRGSTRGRGGNC